MNTQKYFSGVTSTSCITLSINTKRTFIVFLILISHASAFAQLYFAPRVNYTLPVASTFVNFANGDFNKDGIQDLAVANFSGASISVFLGLGSGTFGSPQNYASASGPGGIISFDANKDGNPDISLTNFNNNTIGVFLGDGTGNFSAEQTFGTGSGPQIPIVGDYNEDGMVDIAVSNYTGNTISILLGNGTGTFTPTTSYPTGTNPQVETADLNNDNHLDLIVLNIGNGNISVRLGDGTGTFGATQNYTTGSEPRVTVIRDFNGDGILDVAVGNRTSNTISILIGTGSGTLNAAVNFSSTSPSTLLSDDYNADGKLDLAVANSGNNTVSIYTGDGNGSFSLYQFTTVGSSPAYMRLIITDLNNDGLLDILTTNDGTNLIGVLLGNTPLGGAGTSLKFNGSNNEAQLGTWFNHQNFTITMWVKPGITQVTSATIIDNNHTASRSWTFEQNVNALNEYTFGGVSVNLAADVWQHVALVSSGGTRSIYLNGCLVGSFNSGTIAYDGTQSLRLGSFGGGGRNWNGELDEVRIYDSGLSAAQIQNSINGEIPTNSPDLIAYYRMNEGSGSFIYDGTTSTNTGTLVNGPTFQLSDYSLPVPTLVSFSPAAGSVGTSVTITGTNFNVTPINNTVTFNGTAATVTASTATSITTMVPTGSTTGKISVTANCFPLVSATDFTVTAGPVITINPQPTSTAVCDGAIASFTLTATGTTNLAYQWQKFNGTAFVNISNGGGYSGTTTSTLNINTVGNVGAGDYRCSISGDLAAPVFSQTASLTFTTNTTLAEITVNGNILTASAGDSYQWYQNGEVVTDAINQSYEFNALEYGVFKVDVTDNGCTATSDEFTYLITGLEQNSDGLKVYPNPVEENLFVEFKPPYTIQVMGLTGNVIRNLHAESITSSMDFSSMAKGIYFLKIKNENQTQYLRIIKK